MNNCIDKISIEDNFVYLINNNIPLFHLNALLYTFEKVKFTRRELANENTLPHHSFDFEPKKFTEMPFFYFLKKCLMSISDIKRDLQLTRAYCNLLFPNDQGGIHQDDSLPGRTITTLSYIVTSWDKTWGGETIFYNNKLDPVLKVLPTPGRTIIFPGEIFHSGTAPSDMSKSRRYTLVAKFT